MPNTGANSFVSFASETLEPRVVLYIDILGFKNKVSQGNFNQILKFFDTLKLHKGNGGMYKEHDPATAIAPSFSFFSDSIIISYPLDFEQRKALLPSARPHIPPPNQTQGDACFWAVGLAITLQCKCFLEFGLLTRGAVTIGDAYHNDEKNIVFGPALNKAVTLEQEIAVFPRVIMDKAISDLSYSRKDYLKQDTDGYWFVNPFAPALSDSEDFSFEKFKFRFINDMPKRCDKHIQKWHWLAMQLNEALKKAPVEQSKMNYVYIE